MHNSTSSETQAALPALGVEDVLMRPISRREELSRLLLVAVYQGNHEQRERCLTELEHLAFQRGYDAGRASRMN